ncbi:MAG: EamA family transporter [Candidatus Lokiarchaeota archaeon]|nr:EamA family transporter [Candidatus Lokiarchaeota archaeon]
MVIIPFFLKKKNIKNLLIFLIKEYKKLIIIGVAFGLHFVFWNLSLDLTTVGNSVFLVNTSPIFVALISFFYIKEKLGALQWIGIVLSIIGSLLITFRDITLTGLWLGDILALMSAIFLAIYLVGGRKLRFNYQLLPYVFIIYFIGSITMFFSVLIIETSFFIYSGLDWLYILGLVIISTLFGHTLYNYSLKRVSASKISIVLLLEPVLSTIWAIFAFNEIPTYELILGAIIIVIGIILVLRYRIRRNDEN